MPRRYNSEDSKRRILAACAKLFLEKGYTNTKVAEILKAADVSVSTFQNIFRAKDGVLTEFVRLMFDRQFGAAKKLTADVPSAAHVYAMETALQLTLTELSESLRDIYVETYTFPETFEMICRRMTAELQAAFGGYLPECKESDFYEMDLATGSMMRGFMVRRCDQYFTLERKIHRYLDVSLCLFHVPEQERAQIIEYVLAVDLRAVAMQVMDSLFSSLSMQFELPPRTN